MYRYTANIGNYDFLEHGEIYVYKDRLESYSDAMTNRWYKFNPSTKHGKCLYQDSNLTLQKALLSILEGMNDESIILFEHARGSEWTVYNELLLNVYRRKISIIQAVRFLFQNPNDLDCLTSHNSIILYNHPNCVNGFWKEFVEYSIHRDQLYFRSWLDKNNISYKLLSYSLFQKYVTVERHSNYGRTHVDEFLGIIGLLVLLVCQLFVFRGTPRT